MSYVVPSPKLSAFDDYQKELLRQIAAAVGVSYEQLSSNYERLKDLVEQERRS